MAETYAARGRPPYTMRLGTAERRLIEAAAACKDLPLSTFIRDAAITAARRELGAIGEPNGVR